MAEGKFSGEDKLPQDDGAHSQTLDEEREEPNVAEWTWGRAWARKGVVMRGLFDNSQGKEEGSLTNPEHVRWYESPSVPTRASSQCPEHPGRPVPMIHCAHSHGGSAGQFGTKAAPWNDLAVGSCIKVT